MVCGTKFKAKYDKRCICADCGQWAVGICVDLLPECVGSLSAGASTGGHGCSERRGSEKGNLYGQWSILPDFARCNCNFFELRRGSRQNAQRSADNDGVERSAVEERYDAEGRQRRILRSF